MRVDNRIVKGGVDYVRLERKEVTIELYNGEILKYYNVDKTENKVNGKEIKN
jgi:hypothetical protein